MAFYVYVRVVWVAVMTGVGVARAGPEADALREAAERPVLVVAADPRTCRQLLVRETANGHKRLV